MPACHERGDTTPAARSRWTRTCGRGAGRRPGRSTSTWRRRRRCPRSASPSSRRRSDTGSTPASCWRPPCMSRPGEPAYISRKKHNLFGYNAYDRARSALRPPSPLRGEHRCHGEVHQGVVPDARRSLVGRPADPAEHAAVLVLVPPLGDRREPDRDLDPPPLPGSSVDQVRRARGRRPAQRPEPGLGPSHLDRRRHPGGGRLRRHLETIALDSEVVAGPLVPPVPAGPGLLDGVTFQGGSASLSPVAPVPSAPEPAGPTSVAARRVRTEARAITLAVPAPREPGSYQLDVDMLDKGGRPLPAAEWSTSRASRSGCGAIEP